MGIRIVSIDGDGDTCLYDSVTRWAFGPVAEEDTLQEFLKWAGELGLPDLRSLSPSALEEAWKDFYSRTRVSYEDLPLV